MLDPKAERNFLHDLASPLTSLQLNVENIVMMLEDGKAEDLASAKAMAESCMKQVQKMSELIRSRRALLIQEMEGK